MSADPGARRDTPPGAGGDGLRWALRWGAAALVVGVLFVAGYVAVVERAVLPVVGALYFGAVLGSALVLPMLLVAAALRWLQGRGGAGRRGLAGAVLGGLASGPLALLALATLRAAAGAAGGDGAGLARALPQVPLASMALLPPLVLAGGAAGYLAHRRVLARSLRWWATVVGTAALSLLLMVPWETAGLLVPSR